MHFSGIQAKIFEVSSKTGDNVGKIITQFQSNSIITFVHRRKHSVPQGYVNYAAVSGCQSLEAPACQNYL